jgi:hypothetical protein
MAGGAGVEYYFGYRLPQNDLAGQDWRSRDKTWDYCRLALEFFRDNQIPFWEMSSADGLIGNSQSDNSKYCLAKKGEVYLIYLPNGGTTEIDLTGVAGIYSAMWFNPRSGSALQPGTVAKVAGGSKALIGFPPTATDMDWLAVLRITK